MSIASIGSTTSTNGLYGATVNTATQLIGTSSQNQQASDSVTISSEALAALRAGQGGEPPPMTDDMAKKMGEDIQKQDADLFTQLDTDQDGVLSTDEADAGKDAIGDAIRSGAVQPPKPPEESGASADGGTAPSSAAGAGSSSASAAASTTSDLTTQQITTLHAQGLKNDEIAQQLGITEQEVAKALEAKA